MSGPGDPGDDHLTDHQPPSDIAARSDPPAPPRRLVTRRRFLRDATLVALGGASVTAVAYELITGAGTGGSAAGVSPSGALAAVGLSAVTPGIPASAAPTPVGTDRQHFHSRPDLTPPILHVSAAVAGTAQGHLFLTPNNGADSDGPTILDEAGNLLWQEPHSAAAATDLRVATYNGAPVLTWWEGTVNGGIGSGEHVVVDDRYREIARIVGGEGKAADLHEFQLTPSGSALFFSDSSAAPRMPAGASAPSWAVMDCVVTEVDVPTGRLLFEWHTADHIDIDESYATEPTKDGQVYDYIHANSIDLLPNGDLLVSARNTCAIYRVRPSTGEIVWRLGGKKSDFAMGAGTTFGYQHDARLQPDGTYTIFDDESAPGHSRAIVLRLDETAMTATLVREYRRPVDILSTSQGNMQILPNGNVFVGWGSQPYITEFAADGTLLFDATFPAAIQSYRDFRLPWTGRPIEPPDVAMEPADAGAMQVYASWNGATEVATWEVLAGDTVGSLQPLTSTPRTGFETAITVTTTHRLLAVRARDASGAVLGVSVPASTPSD